MMMLHLYLRHNHLFYSGRPCTKSLTDPQRDCLMQFKETYEWTRSLLIIKTAHKDQAGCTSLSLVRNVFIPRITLNQYSQSGFGNTT